MISRKDIKPADAWAASYDELRTYLDWLNSRGFLKFHSEDDGYYDLTLEGWLEVERLQAQHDKVASLAFMGMPFGDKRLDNIVANYFVPAAQEAGFELRRLDEGQPAGLIDDQLRVRLRTAQFVVADLTSGNNGAYWEAGFAEGLGTPVIYTCERSVFTSLESGKRTHFDTNHLVTVLWDESRLADAAKSLKASIRNTLPHLAKLTD